MALTTDFSAPPLPRPLVGAQVERVYDARVKPEWTWTSFALQCDRATDVTITTIIRYQQQEPTQ